MAVKDLLYAGNVLCIVLWNRYFAGDDSEVRELDTAASVGDSNFYSHVGKNNISRKKTNPQKHIDSSQRVSNKTTYNLL